MILSGLSHGREYLENLDKSGKLKKRSRKVMGKSGNFTSVVIPSIIYQGKISCHLLGCEIYKNEMLVLSINHFFNKSYLRVAMG